MNTVPLGELAAQVMDDLGVDFPHEDAVVAAVGLIVIVDNGEGETFTRIYSNRHLYFEKFGLFTAGVDCLQNGEEMPMLEDGEADEDE